MTRRRLDAELVRRGLVASRQAARDEIEAGRVTVGGAPAMKPARLVDPAEAVVVAASGRRFVSRGGAKLEAALEHFEIDVTGLRVLDAGASTGGFTDCLLQRGASNVVAVDVGYGQLDGRLRNDARVECMERTNVRHLSATDIVPAVDLVVGDLSFISVVTVLGALIGVARPDALLVLLVKPQFEAGREEASRGRGVIRDPEVWARVLKQVVAAFVASGVGIMGIMTSPVRGPDGNREFLVHARIGAPTTVSEAEIDAVVQATHAEERSRL